MAENIRKALAAGSEMITAWADVLDRINVFPVPDGDTGRNLVFSLSPLRRSWTPPDKAAQELMLSARGNSGNIASRFFSVVLDCEDVSALPDACRRGRDAAYQAVRDPKSGTMLTLFDIMVESLESRKPLKGEAWVERAVESMEDAVRSTTDQLPELKQAGVVDAGALGMFIFFDACFNALVGREAALIPVAEKFKDSLSLAESWQESLDHGYCLDVVLQVERETSAAMNQVYALGESVVTLTEGDLLKVHLHTDSQEEVRDRLKGLGSIVRWASDDLEIQTRKFARPARKQALHIMTDAAGSLTRDDAVALGVTMLDSYINVGDVSLPETYVDRAKLFESMRDGIKVSTAQASMVERHQHYHKVLNLYPKVLYLVVGSAYTGNCQVAEEWKARHDPEDRMLILDSGAASGRLGLAVMAAARISLATDDPQEVIDFSKRVIQDCKEYIFLDKLQYLAAGGRLSKTSAFFGDVLKMKPVVTPLPQGVEKVAVTRSRNEQFEFAIKRLETDLAADQRATIMLEFTDNREWLAYTVKPELEKRFPQAEIILQPVSLTSAAHMGPGTWAVAFLPYQA